MLGYLWHDMTISVISFQHQLTCMTCMHKCNSHVDFIQTDLSPSLFLFSATLSPMSQFDYSYCVGFLIQYSFLSVQSTSSYMNMDLDCNVTGIKE